MSRFSIPINEKKKRNALLWAYIFIAGGLICFIVFLFFDDRQTWIRMANLVISLNALGSGIERLRNIKKIHFIEINENHIAWSYPKSKRVTSVDWNDIRWIKKEWDGGISLFQDSSFSKYFSLEKFSGADQKQMLLLLEEKANDRQIRLINFLAQASEVA